MSGENWSFSDTKLNYPGFDALRKSPGAQEWVGRVGAAMAAEASARSGEVYDFRLSRSRSRARGVVKPKSAAAARDSAANLTLLKVFDAGRTA